MKQHQFPSDLPSPLRLHAPLSFALTKPHVWALTFTLCPRQEDHEWPFATTLNLHLAVLNMPKNTQQLVCALHSPPFLKLIANKAISIHLPCLMFFYICFCLWYPLMTLNTLFLHWDWDMLLMYIASVKREIWRRGKGSKDRKAKQRGRVCEWESPEGHSGSSDTFCRAEGSISQMLLCSGPTAHSRFLSSFHPHPHLFLLPLIRSDWIWPADAKHSQCPAGRAESRNMQHANPLTAAATKTRGGPVLL